MYTVLIKDADGEMTSGKCEFAGLDEAYVTLGKSVWIETTDINGMPTEEYGELVEILE